MFEISLEKSLEFNPLLNFHHEWNETPDHSESKME
jgi:hypothetical protein